MTLANAGNVGRNGTAWELAVAAYRTLAANARAGIMVSVVPTILLLVGSAAIAFAILGDPFPQENDSMETPGSMLLGVPIVILFALGTLVVFVSWTRVILGLQPPEPVSFIPQHLKAAPVWLLAWLVMPLAVALAASIIFIPLALLLFSVEGSAPAPMTDNLPIAAGYLIAAVVIVVIPGITFATARLVLHAALVSADLAQSDIAPYVLSRWVRAGVALVLSTLPLMAVSLILGEIFSSVDWVLSVFGVLELVFLVLLQGAVCALLIRAGR